MSPTVRLPCLLGVGLVLLGGEHAHGNHAAAREPLKIGTTAQLFVDDYLVDNRYPLKGGHSANVQVLRKFHAPTKHPNNPVLVDPDVSTLYQAVRYEPDTKLFRMWYGASYAHVRKNLPETLPGHYHVRYAESKDGITWTRPNLGLYPDPYHGRPDSNICFAHPRFAELEIRERPNSTPLANHWIASPGPILLNENVVPPQDMRGYKYIMTYAQSGRGDRPEDKNQVYLVGSKDGIRWDRANQKSVGMIGISDGWFGMLYDPQQKLYLAYARPRDRYQATSWNSLSHVDFDRNDFVYAGIVRRVGWMESASLWTEWDFTPRAAFLPDAHDLKHGANALMSVTVNLHEGVYFAFLKPFFHQRKIWTELAVSRDGRDFERLHDVIVDTGADGTWDSKQAWATAHWVEFGDEWWIYYFGTGNAPNVVLKEAEEKRTGLARIRKEGFLSLHTPDVGGAIVTKVLTWPGGDLLVNCDVPRGEMRVRVSDAKRKGIEGFDFTDCVPFTGSGVRQRVTWRKQTLDSLRNRDIRLEFYFSNEADLYAFQATGATAR